MRKLITAALGAVGIAALSMPASAVPVQSSWNFNLGSATILNASQAQFTSGDGKVLTVSAYTNYANNSSSLLGPQVFMSGLDIGPNGLGVDNGACEVSFIICLGTDSAEVDNFKYFDFLVLELPSDLWLPIEMSFTLNTILGDLDADDYEIWGSNDLFVDMTMVYDGPNSGPALNPIDLQNPVDSHLVATGQTFRYIYVSGAVGGGSDNNDDFRVTGFVGSTDENNVPEPASLALLGLGLVGIGAMRRRKAA